MADRRVVLVHSAVADARQWERQIGLLKAHGFDVHAPDLPGFGQEPVPSEPFSFVDRIAALLPAALVGNSFGGRIALETALAHPKRVTRLVLVDPAVRDHDWSAEVLDYWDEEERLLERGDIDGATELTLRVFASPHVRDVVRPMQRRAYELQLAVPDPSVRWPDARPLEQLDVPTLVVAGRRDTQDFITIAERLAKTIPNARLQLVDGAAHLPNLEAPEAFDALLLDFLDG